MSYNTRRQAGQGMGMGRGSTGMYHQQRPAGQTRMPNQNSYQSFQPQQPYSTQQQPPSQQQQQKLPPVPSTQPPLQPPQPPQQQQPPPPLVQKQQQQQPQQQQQQQHQPPPPPPPQQPLAEANVLAPQQLPPPPPPPTIKKEDDDAVTAMDAEDEKSADGTADAKTKPWQKKRVAGFKVNKKIKRRRQNARLRKILQPKNAMMVLHELKAGIKFTFQEHTNALTQTIFIVNAEVDGKVYVGQGLSKPLAKQNAAENVLKALLLEKMSDAAMKAQQQDNSEGEQMVQDVNNGSGDSAEGSDNEGHSTKPPAPEDDVPWGSLASFALYKLFTDWQSQGTHVPTPKQGPAPQLPAQPVIAGAPSPMKKIPENPTDRHPVMLLNQLKPGVQFNEVSRDGTPPNLTFTMSVIIDGKTYNGVAKNKKEAKKEAAIAALAGSFNIHY